MGSGWARRTRRLPAASPTNRYRAAPRISAESTTNSQANVVPTGRRGVHHDPHRQPDANRQVHEQTAAMAVVWVMRSTAWPSGCRGLQRSATWIVTAPRFM